MAIPLKKFNGTKMKYRLKLIITSGFLVNKKKNFILDVFLYFNYKIYYNLIVKKLIMIVIDANKLEIFDSNRNDSGQYRCEAANQFSSSTQSVNINVDGKLK